MTSLLMICSLTPLLSKVLATLMSDGQSWAPALLGTKSSGAAAYRYSYEKVAPLLLLAYKTTAAAATSKQ